MGAHRAWMLAVLALAVPLGLALGCQQVSSVSGGGKAADGFVTFGFDLECDVEEQQAEGNFVLQDHDQSLTLHGRAKPGLPGRAFCGYAADDPSPMGHYLLDYRKGNEVLGTAEVWITEGSLHVKVEGGPMDGYDEIYVVPEGSVSFED